jgi:hypothetical protein
MLGWWTIGRATGVGAPAGLLALVLWPLYARFQEPMLWPFAAALGVALLCGLSILLITALDMLTRRRGESLRPVRAFDIALGITLAAPSLAELQGLSPQLGLG